ncbi:MAG: hypothetical protein QME76_07555 [Bacillota bacterium]|nr:hypothetical protein [Bacillota bacterium]
MRCYGRRVLFFLLLVALVLSPGAAWAGDPWYRMLYSTNQDALVLGMVRESGETTVTVEVSRVVSGEDPGRTVAVSRAPGWLGPGVAPGDLVLISLDRLPVGGYRNALGVYRVSSLDPKTLNVLDGYCGPDGLAAVQWWLNHGGFAGGDFYGIRKKLFWRHHETGREVQIYPPPGEGGEASVLPALTGTDDGLSGGVDRWLPVGLGMLLLALVMAAGWFWWCRRRGVS